MLKKNNPLQSNLLGSNSRQSSSSIARVLPANRDKYLSIIFISAHVVLKLRFADSPES